MIRLLILFAGAYIFQYFTHQTALTAGFFVLFLALIAWGIHLDIREKKESVRQALANIEDALQKRYDLLTKMFDVTRGYVKFREEELSRIGKIIENAKVSPLSSTAVLSDTAGAQNILRATFADMIAGLRDRSASERFESLIAGVNEVEENLSASRRFYNFAVKEYNTAIRSFPALVVARIRKEKAGEYFEVTDPKVREDVKLSMD
ncbi:MAG TPA: LemA family protein [Spirochaetota bacterium]|nr:LemA family protein [Spirochaetota bacterium]